MPLMSPRTPPRSSVLAWLGLAVGVALIGLRAEPLRDKLDEARASQGVVTDDRAFYRANAVLGPEAPILEAVRTQLPRGASIRVTGEGSAELVGRRQRFWLALLPDYRVTGDAETEICPRACAQGALEVLAEGASFVWVRRGEGSP